MKVWHVQFEINCSPTAVLRRNNCVWYKYCPFVNIRILPALAVSIDSSLWQFDWLVKVNRPLLRMSNISEFYHLREVTFGKLHTHVLFHSDDMEIFFRKLKNILWHSIPLDIFWMIVIQRFKNKQLVSNDICKWIVFVVYAISVNCIHMFCFPRCTFCFYFDDVDLL